MSVKVSSISMAMFMKVPPGNDTVSIAYFGQNCKRTSAEIFGTGYARALADEFSFDTQRSGCVLGQHCIQAG